VWTASIRRSSVQGCVMGKQSHW